MSTREKGVITESIAPGLELEEIAVAVGSFHLGPLSLSIPPAKTLAVLGPSGAGKSTMLRAIAGFESVGGGAVRFGGEDVSYYKPGDRRVGYVFQTYALFPNMTAGGNIEFPLRIRNRDEAEISRRMSEIIGELKISPDYLPKDVNELPEGIKQLAAIGRERAHLFDLLILDEPMSQLDTFIRKQMRVFLRELVRSFKKTTVVALTDPEDTLSLSDYIAVVDRGYLVEFGPTRQVYACPNHPVTMEMLSPLGLNSLPVEIDHGRIQPYGIQAPPPNPRPYRPQPHLYFRPEETKLVAEGGIPGQLTHKTFLDGRRELLHLVVDREVVTVVAPIGAVRGLPQSNPELEQLPEVRFTPTNPAVF